MIQEIYKDLDKQSLILDNENLLTYIANKYAEKTIIASSLGAEDQVIASIISRLQLPISIFSIDTGRLYEETYELIDENKKELDINIKMYFPDVEDVQTLIRDEGYFGFYKSLEKRKNCCYIRKVKPLNQALEGYDIWITGLRAEQSITRSESKIVEIDNTHKMIKVNPLMSWSKKEVFDYIKKYNVPYNKLHDKSFPSIGCAPCTRAVQKGQGIREGRWWWESSTKKECGLHL